MLARPENPAAYGGGGSVFQCAAAIGHAIARRQALIDGDKRCAAIAALMFLLINGWRWDVSETYGQEVFEGVAEGRISEDELEAIFAENSVADDGAAYSDKS